MQTRALSINITLFCINFQRHERGWFPLWLTISEMQSHGIAHCVQCKIPIFVFRCINSLLSQSSMRICEREKETVSDMRSNRTKLFVIWMRGSMSAPSDYVWMHLRIPIFFFSFRLTPSTQFELFAAINKECHKCNRHSIQHRLHSLCVCAWIHYYSKWLNTNNNTNNLHNTD